MIYVPRAIIELLYRNFREGRTSNPCVCTKIDYKGYQISISSDTSHTVGDLFRTDIRVFTNPGAVPGADVTDMFLSEGEDYLHGTGQVLHEVMNQIDELSWG